MVELTQADADAYLNSLTAEELVQLVNGYLASREAER